MNLRKRYSSGIKKKIGDFFVIYILFTFVLLFCNTFARYTTIVEDSPNIKIATWDVKINDTDITNGQTIQNIVELVPDDTSKTKNGKIAPGQSGSFNIIINPDGTDVAIEYTISFDISNLPSDISLTSYEIGDTSVDMPDDNIITGEINLDTDNIQGLSENDSKDIKVNWEWEENTQNIKDIPTGDENYYISVTINVKQKIG